MICSKLKCLGAIICVLFSLSLLSVAQEPQPSSPKAVSVPRVQEFKLKNGLKVAVIERKNIPLVSVQLMIPTGAAGEGIEQAGLADMTASLLTKGTKTRTATQIAEQMEFLGSSISSGADWNSTNISMTVMNDKLDQAMPIFAEVVLNPKFEQKEIDLLKAQTLDGLAYNLKQPGFLANYVASVYSFNEHPSGGTPESIKSLDRNTILSFKDRNYFPSSSVLTFSGSISPIKARMVAEQLFSVWRNQLKKSGTGKTVLGDSKTGGTDARLRILVVDLPKSGQAAVNYARSISNSGRVECKSLAACFSNPNFFPAMVLNSVLGGGYSSRLNLEIRIKRGLSYGANSNISWREFSSNFSTRAQTKNESAAEVAQLVMAEINKLMTKNVEESELVPRKSVLTGGFGRNLETNAGLVSAISGLYGFDLSPNELNKYMPGVEGVTSDQIKSFAAKHLPSGDFIIVGDYTKFKDDLAKRFPDIKPLVIPADKLKLSDLR